MKKEFDFDKIGKRMPYTVPDGFFSEMEENILKEITNDAVAKKKPRSSSYIRMAVKGMIAVAAVMALFFVLRQSVFDNERVEVEDIEQAFGKLSAEDQMAVAAVYQDDIFINE